LAAKAARAGSLGLVYFTPASNIGLTKGACSLIEKALKDKELIWIACRHHKFEIMLSDIFIVALGTTSGPDIVLFKRFQSQRMYIDAADVQRLQTRDWVRR